MVAFLFVKLSISRRVSEGKPRAAAAARSLAAWATLRYAHHAEKKRSAVAAACGLPSLTDVGRE